MASHDITFPSSLYIHIIAGGQRSIILLLIGVQHKLLGPLLMSHGPFNSWSYIRSFKCFGALPSPPLIIICVRIFKGVNNKSSCPNNITHMQANPSWGHEFAMNYVPFILGFPHVLDILSLSIVRCATTTVGNITRDPHTICNLPTTIKVHTVACVV